MQVDVPMPSRHRIGLVHAVPAAMPPIAEAFRAHWPEADLLNLLEDSLSADRAANPNLTSALTDRIAALADYAILAGARGILFTCSAFGPAIDQVASQLSVPVLKPNEAMFAEALARGAHVGMVATFAPAIATMEAEFRHAALAIRPSATITSVLAAGALEALNAGNTEAHDRIVANAAEGLGDCNVVMLAQFSTSRAKATVERILGRDVLTSPAAAVVALKRAVHDAQQHSERSSAAG